jgi:hypothetical protein
MDEPFEFEDSVVAVGADGKIVIVACGVCEVRLLSCSAQVALNLANKIEENLINDEKFSEKETDRSNDDF